MVHPDDQNRRVLSAAGLRLKPQPARCGGRAMPMSGTARSCTHRHHIPDSTNAGHACAISVIDS